MEELAMCVLLAKDVTLWRSWFASYLGLKLLWNTGVLSGTCSYQVPGHTLGTEHRQTSLDEVYTLLLHTRVETTVVAD